MNRSGIDANESVAHRSSWALPLNYLQRYGLAVVSIGVALGISLFLQHFGFRVPSALLLLFAVAISSWYAGAGPAVLAAILSTISFYWYFVEPVLTIYIYRSQIPYFVIFAAFAALLSRFGTFRQRAEADLRRTHDQLKVERPKLGSRTIALLYFAFSSCWILFTDRLVHGLGLSNAYLLKVSEAKGILFISLSTLLMYVLVEKVLRQRHSVAAAYWQLVETAQEGVWSVDAEGKTVFANENMAAILGTSPGEMIGKSILPFVPQEKKDELLNHLLQREQGLQEHYEFPFLRADGAQVWTLLRVSPVLRDGQHGGCLALVSDITKRKRTEEALSRSESYLAEAQRLSHTGSWALDVASGNYVYSSEEYIRISGFDPQQGLPAKDHPLQQIHPDDVDKFWQAFQKLIDEKVDSEGEYRIVLPDGTVKYVHAIRHPVLNANGELVEVVGTTIDITERKRAEEALRRSEAYLAESQRLTQTGSFAYIPGGAVLYWSEEALRIWGFDQQQAILSHEMVRQRIHPDDRGRARECAEKALGTKTDWYDEFRIVLPDGTVKHIHAIHHPVFSASGELVEVVGTHVDVTERKRAEEALRESETRFRTFVDHAGDALFVLDFEQGTVVDVNRQACESLGYTRQELIGKTPLAFHLDSDRAEMESAAERAAAGETVVDTHRHRRKDGTVFPVEANTSSFCYGGRRFLLQVARDITDRVQAEEQRERLRQLEADLAHINRVSMMGELAASIAHEVNQPLSGVVSNGSACLRWLAGDAPNLEEAREAARRIVRDGKRAGEVIARIRALTKKISTPREKLDLNETLRQVLALVGDEATRRSVNIQTKFADDLSPVSGDQVQLQQVVLNLAMNAIEAMSSIGDRARELVITTQNIDTDQVQVTVEDSGVGLDPNTMPKIFEPFYTTKPTGMGMGLSISRSILQAHGGRLWATAKDGPGTIFYFTLPKYHEEESHAGVSAA